MIRIPKEIEKAMKTLEKEGFECYAVGECVRDAFVNLKPLDWDVAADASEDDLKKIFPEGKIINHCPATIRLEFGDVQEDGLILDIRHFENNGREVLTINEDLEGRLFTCNAIGESLSRTPVDPFGGRKDIQAKNIRTIGIVDKVFAENPETMIEMVRIAAEMEFDIPNDALEAIKKCGDLILQKNHSEVQKQFMLAADSYNASECVRLLKETGLLGCLMGKPMGKKLAIKEKSELELLIKNIDRAAYDQEVRLGLIYLCFDGSKTKDAIKKLSYRKDVEEKLLMLHEEFNTSYGINDKLRLKSYINKVGMENYKYIQKVSKAKKIVFNETFDAPAQRETILRQIERNNEVITRDDVDVDENMLIQAGIAESRQDAEELILRMVDASIKEVFSKDSDFMALAKELATHKRRFPYKSIKWIKK